MRIALFVTCLGDALNPEVGRATVRILERPGHEVTFPAGQTCCGQMHTNTGYQRQALGIIRQYVDTFERALADGAGRLSRPADRASGRCAINIRMLRGGPARRAFAARAATVAEHTYELSELLVDVPGHRCRRLLPHRVTYHPTCHSCACSASATSRSNCCARCVASTWWNCLQHSSVADSAAPLP